jgi:hypothetical protein
MKAVIPKSITGPIVVERHDEDDGNLIYEVWDHGGPAYHMICSVSEVHCDNAKAEAEFIALSMNNAIGAIMAIEKATKRDYAPKEFWTRGL